MRALPSWLNHFQKALSPNPVGLGVKIQHMNLRGVQTSVHSKRHGNSGILARAPTGHRLGTPRANSPACLVCCKSSVGQRAPLGLQVEAVTGMVRAKQTRWSVDRDCNGIHSLGLEKPHMLRYWMRWCWHSAVPRPWQWCLLVLLSVCWACWILATRGESPVCLGER